VRQIAHRSNPRQQDAGTSNTNCAENAAVEYDALAGVNHIWPGELRISGKGFDATAAIRVFFAAHSVPDSQAAT
jgi:poly(3-hydroxybutyrate) depolymerase